MRQKRMVVLGEGRLSWPAAERRSNRYGSIGLFEPSDPDRIRCVDIRAHKGQRGRIYATVLVSRDSGHIGDLALGIGPSRTDVGVRVLLGTGTLTSYSGEYQGYFGIVPDDPDVIQRSGLRKPWMNPRQLYCVHDHDVRIDFLPVPKRER